jgi:hypothetical protein
MACATTAHSASAEISAYRIWRNLAHSPARVQLANEAPYSGTVVILSEVAMRFFCMARSEASLLESPTERFFEQKTPSE